MKILQSTCHPDVSDLKGSILPRTAARGIILDGDNILLMYTERYHDYSLPSGGVDADEDIIAGLIHCRVDS